MRAIFAGLAVAVCVAAPSIAQEAEIEGVIGAQIDAFQADDYGTAFGYASPMIQGMFRTPENFGLMVREGYPMVHRPDFVQYLELEDKGGVQRQTVMIRDLSGALHFLEYEMVDGPDGWKINGVRMIQSPDVGA